jgi:hypothetical protein
MSLILIDRVASVVFHAGVLRVECMSSGPNGEERPSGTLLIPGPAAGLILQSLVGATQELDKRLREQAAAQSQSGTATPAEAGEPEKPRGRR